jgi:hypothetical protein
MKLDSFISSLLIEAQLVEIPNDWSLYAHHMTIAFGKEAKQWANNNKDLVGHNYLLQVNGVYYDDRVIAVTVIPPKDTPSDLKVFLRAKIPHITIATSPDTKPVYSNEMLNSTNTKIDLKMTLAGHLKFQDGYLGIILVPEDSNRLVSAVKNALERQDTILESVLGRILLEGKLEDIKIKDPERSRYYDIVARLHHKYLDWAYKQFENHNPKYIIDILTFFKDNEKRFANRDINSYEDATELAELIEQLGESKSSKTKILKSNGVEKIYADEQFELLYIKSKDASICFGRGTKWCISGRVENKFDAFSRHNSVFYFLINKSLPQEDSNYKIAIHLERSKEFDEVQHVELYDAIDTPLKSNQIPVFTRPFIDLAKTDAKNRTPNSAEVLLTRAGSSNNEIMKLLKGKTQEELETFASKSLPQYLHNFVELDVNNDTMSVIAKNIPIEYINLFYDKEPVQLSRVISRIQDDELKKYPELFQHNDERIRKVLARKLPIRDLSLLDDDESDEVRDIVSNRLRANLLRRMF